MTRSQTSRCGRFARIATIVLAAGALTTVGACRKERERLDSETDRVGERHHERELGREADRSAREDERAQREAADTQRDLDRREGEVTDTTATADAEFTHERALRSDALRSELFVLATQPMLIASIASGKGITDRSQADINDKLNAFQTKLDEANTSIQGIQTADAETFKERDKEASKHIKEANKARDEAWKALDKADVVEPS